MEPLQIGVLLSGSGTNLQAIIDEILDVAGDYDDFISLSAGSPALGSSRT